MAYKPFNQENLRVLRSTSDYSRQRSKESQLAAAFILGIIGSILFIVVLMNNKIAALDMIIGIIFGSVMYRGDFSFSANLRNPVYKHSYKFTLLFWKMCVLTTIGLNGIIFIKTKLGLFDYEAYLSQPTPVSPYFCLAATIFGAGLMLLGSAGTGLIKKCANGKGDYILALIFYFLGSYSGVFVRELALKYTGERTFYLPEMFGWGKALLIQFILLSIYFQIAYKGVKKHGFYEKRDFQTIPSIIKRRYTLKKKISLITNELFLKGIEANSGIYIITILALIYFFFNSKVIALSMPLSVFGYKLLNNLGVDVSNVLTPKVYKQVMTPFFKQTGLMLVVGFAIGSAFISLIRAEYKPCLIKSKKQALTMILGGFLVGFGVQGIDGANVGEIYGAISMLSLSGYIIIPFTLIGLFLAKPLYKWLLS